MLFATHYPHLFDFLDEFFYSYVVFTVKLWDTS